MSKSRSKATQKRRDRRPPASPAGRTTTVVLAAIFVVLLGGFGLSRSLFGKGAAGAPPTPAMALPAPSPAASSIPITLTAVPPVNPSGEGATPTPDWQQLFAPADTQGAGLLVLHTNDTWGYLDPCG